jgi:glucose dehydrogenase
MKKQKPKFSIGHIVTNTRNNFRRQIQAIKYEERSGMMKVMYAYYDEELNKLYMPTGKFDPSRIGYCSQDHLVSWMSGR